MDWRLNSFRSRMSGRSRSIYRVASLSSRGEASVNCESCSCHVSSLGACEVRDYAGDLITLAVAFNGQEFFQRFGERTCSGVHISINRTGLHNVDSDAARTQITCETARESCDGGLAHAINTAAGDGHAVSVDTANRDDAPALLHVTRGLLSRYEDSADIHGHNAVKFLDGEFIERFEDGDARVVNEHVKSVKGFHSFGHSALDRARIGVVGLDGKRAAACRHDGIHHIIGVFLSTVVGDGYRGAVCRKAFRDCSADTARASGDESDFPIKLV